MPAWSAIGMGKGAANSHLLAAGWNDSTVWVRVPSSVPPPTTKMWSDSTSAWKRVRRCSMLVSWSQEALHGSNRNTWNHSMWEALSRRQAPGFASRAAAGTDASFLQAGGELSSSAAAGADTLQPCVCPERAHVRPCCWERAALPTCSEQELEHVGLMEEC